MNPYIPGLDAHLESRLERDSDACSNPDCPACFCPRCLAKMTDGQLWTLSMDLCPLCLTNLVTGVKNGDKGTQSLKGEKRL